MRADEDTKNVLFSCSVKTAAPTRRSGATKATTKGVTSHTTTGKVPLSVSSEEPVVAAQIDEDVGEEHFQNGKPVHSSATLIVALSVASVFVVVVMVPAIMVVIFIHQQKQRR